MAAITIPKLHAAKASGRKIVMITAYDHPSAVLADAAGVDVILVGDSLGNVVQGSPTTLGVSLEESLYHTRIVARGTTNAMVIGDMPFGTYQASPADAVRAGVRYLKEAGAAAVKLEGGVARAATVRALVDAEIPVMGHIGLTPQSVHVMGGFKVQRAEGRIRADAEALVQAGVFAMVLEGVPGAIAAAVTAAVGVPIIGIGAGAACDGQVLVWHDLLGLTASAPKFVKRYAELRTQIEGALTAYADEVRSGAFPSDAHTYQ